MTFEDCQPGDKVCLTLKSAGKKLNMESSIINIVDNCLVVEPFKMNNAILDFPKNIEIEMMVVPSAGDVPYLWQRVFVSMKVYHEQNVHIIQSKLPGIKMNRRGNFRVFLGNYAKLSNVSENPINITLRDLSSGGFAFLTDKSVDIPLHAKVTVEYSDQSMQKYFELSGRPIRKVEQETNILYGCILDRRNPELDNYLNQKQMSTRPNANKNK